MVLTFKDIFGREVDTIQSGSELYLAFCLDHYCQEKLGVRFDITGCAIDKRVVKSPIMQFVQFYQFPVNPKYATPTVSEAEEKEMRSKIKYNSYFYETTSDIMPRETVKTATHTERIFDFSNVTAANSKMQGANASTAYISLLALHLLYNYINKFKCLYTVVIDDTRRSARSKDYVKVEVLKRFGNKLIDDSMIRFEYVDKGDMQLDYLAENEYNRELGYMNRTYRDSEKHRIANTLFKIGDVVLIYKCKEARKHFVNQSIQSCYLAVITGIDDKGISLREYPSIATRLTQIKQVEQYMAQAPNVYTETDKYTFPSSQQSYTWSNIGVCQCRYAEGVFITKPIDEDGTHQWLGSDKVPHKRMFLSTLDTIYAICEDRGIQYNKTRFLNEFFKPYNRVPVYESYMRANTVQK